MIPRWTPVRRALVLLAMAAIAVLQVDSRCRDPQRSNTSRVVHC
jgi:hypothetical protein